MYLPYVQHFLVRITAALPYLLWGSVYTGSNNVFLTLTVPPLLLLTRPIPSSPPNPGFYLEGGGGGGGGGGRGKLPPPPNSLASVPLAKGKPRCLMNNNDSYPPNTCFWIKVCNPSSLTRPILPPPSSLTLPLPPPSSFTLPHSPTPSSLPSAPAVVFHTGIQSLIWSSVCQDLAGLQSLHKP